MFILGIISCHELVGQPLSQENPMTEVTVQETPQTDPQMEKMKQELKKLEDTLYEKTIELNEAKSELAILRQRNTVDILPPDEAYQGLENKVKQMGDELRSKDIALSELEKELDRISKLKVDLARIDNARSNDTTSPSSVNDDTVLLMDLMRQQIEQFKDENQKLGASQDFLQQKIAQLQNEVIAKKDYSSSPKKSTVNVFFDVESADADFMKWRYEMGYFVRHKLVDIEGSEQKALVDKYINELADIIMISSFYGARKTERTVSRANTRFKNYCFTQFVDITDLNFSGLPMIEIPHDAFRFFKNLQGLHMNSCKITDKMLDNCFVSDCFPDIIFLDLGCNDLQQVPNLIGCKKLITVLFNGNHKLEYFDDVKLRELPSNLKNNGSLSIIDTPLGNNDDLVSQIVKACDWEVISRIPQSN